MEQVHIFGRIVDQITSEVGQHVYYDHLNRCRGCFHRDTPRQVPTKKEAEEYIMLKAVRPSCLGNSAERKEYNKLNMYDNNYDWRPHKSGSDGFVGLVSPCGDQLLPEIFVDVFTQFDAINSKPDFVPVFNGEAWALASLSTTPVLMTDFDYNTIIPERWEHGFFFVQDIKSRKWGALSTDCPIVNTNRAYRDRLVCIRQIMPPIADEIYEDSLSMDDELLLIFMTRIGNKIGLLTDFGFSKIEYDTYETRCDSHDIRLIRHDRKRAKRADYFHPDGKNLFINLKRRKYAETPTSTAGQI